MRLILLFLMVAAVSLVAQAQLTKHYLPAASPQPGIGFIDFKPADYTTDPAKKMPLIIVLHGNGESGNGTTDLDKVYTAAIGWLLKNGATMHFDYPNGVKGSFLVLLPQLDPRYTVWQSYYIDEMVKWAKANLNVDEDRIFITGYSLGGGGTWVYPATDSNNASQIAGLVPISGTSLTVGDPCNIAEGGTAVWAIHAADDTQVPVTTTQHVVNTMIACNPVTTPPVASWYPVGQHGIYDAKFYPDTNNKYAYPNIYQWMLGINRRSISAQNQAPIANVGETDTTVVVNSSMPFFRERITAEASSDPNDVIMRYNWQLVSDNLKNIFPFDGYQPVDTSTTWPVRDLDYKNFSWPYRDLEFHALGDYVFRLTVTDMFGATSTQTKTIHITNNGQNTAPYVNLGQDIFLPNGTASQTDTLINIAAKVFDWETTSSTLPLTYTFTQLEGPTVKNDNPDWFQTTLHGFKDNAVYKFRLTARDADGLVGEDELTVSKGTALPVTYLYFSGKNENGKHILNWATSSEINNDHFDLMKGSDGRSFALLATIAASSGSGGIKKYTCTDDSPYEGNNYYLLAQYDIDGTRKLSQVISINNAGSMVVMTYPNPIHNQLNIVVRGNAGGRITMKITDVSGRVLKQLQALKNNGVFMQTIDLGNLQSGMYLLYINQEDKWRSVQRFEK